MILKTLFRLNVPQMFPKLTRSVATKIAKDLFEFSKDGKTLITSGRYPIARDRAHCMPLANLVRVLDHKLVQFQYQKGTDVGEAFTAMMKNGDMTVVKAQSLRIHPEWYTTKWKGLLSIHFCWCGLGKTSFGLRSKVYNEDEDLLYEMQRVYVTCNRKQESIPIPNQLKSCLERMLNTDEGKVIIPSPFSEELTLGQSFTHYISPRPSDLDALYHVYNLNYITYMLDTAVIAAKEGVYSSLKQDIAFGNVEEVVMFYYNALFLGDNVKVETWQDEENPLKLCFKISSDSQLAFHGSVLLREPLLKLSDEVKQLFIHAHEF